MFDMTDYTSSITVKFFIEKEKLPAVNDRIKDGSFVKLEEMLNTTNSPRSFYLCSRYYRTEQDLLSRIRRGKKS